MQNEDCDKINSILYQIWSMEMLDIYYDGNPDAVEIKKELFEIINRNIKNINEIIGTLDFNKPQVSIILNCIPEIIENFEKLEDQISLIEVLKNLQEKYPNVNFKRCIFYSELLYKV